VLVSAPPPPLNPSPQVTTLTNKHQNMDESRTIFSVSPCNGSRPVDFHMQAYDRFEFMYKTAAEFTGNRTRANGTFDGTSATLSVGGGFSGEFENWYTRYSSSGLNDKYKYGTYKLKFSGDLDRPHSHELSTSGQMPSWTENRDLLPVGRRQSLLGRRHRRPAVGGRLPSGVGRRLAKPFPDWQCWAG